MATRVCVSDFELIKCRLKFEDQEMLQTRQPYTAYSIKYEIDNGQICNMSTKGLWE